MTSEPDIESAVQTTPPISSTWSIPLSPRRPRAERATAVTISVVSVIPEIGVIEIIAIAQAETAANRNAITSVRPVEASGEGRGGGLAGEDREAEVEEDREAGGGDAEQHDRHRQAAVGAVALGGRGACPRTSRATSPNACRVACTITGDILRIDRTPAAKIPPMPIGRT